MLITVCQIDHVGEKSDAKISTEAQKSANTQSPVTSSPKTVASQQSDPLLMNELPLMKTISAGQDDDTAADASDLHLARAGTEHLLGDANHLGERSPPGSLPAWTPHYLGERSPLESLMTSKVFPTWRAHHQDFYASKWFRSIQIFIIGIVIAVALILYVLVSPLVDADLFTFPGVIWVFLPLLLGPIPVFLSVVVGGMWWSRVFQ